MQGDLSALIERVEKCSGPDRQLDAVIALNICDLELEREISEIPHFTSSLDAALALVEEKLPGWTRLVDATAPELGICVELFPSDDIAERTESARGDHNRETHATLLALLRALSARDQQDGGGA